MLGSFFFFRIGVGIMVKIVIVTGILIELLGVYILVKKDLFTTQEQMFKVIRNSTGTRGMNRDPEVNSLLNDMLERAKYSRIGFLFVLFGIIIQLVVQLFLS